MAYRFDGMHRRTIERRRKSGLYQHGGVSICEGGIMDAPHVVLKFSKLARCLWLLALGLVYAIGRRRRRSGSYSYDDVLLSVDEGGTMEVPHVL